MNEDQVLALIAAVIRETRALSEGGGIDVEEAIAEARRYLAAARDTTNMEPLAL